MRVSFVACTRNHAPSLARTAGAMLAALSAQPAATGGPVVLDAGSTDATPAVRAGMADHGAASMRILRQPPRGRSAARHAGSAAGCGPGNTRPTSCSAATW